jgi:ubiquinone/menaquinone biosynthesis C-methylase UbiE
MGFLQSRLLRRQRRRPPHGAIWGNFATPHTPLPPYTSPLPPGPTPPDTPRGHQHLPVVFLDSRRYLATHPYLLPKDAAECNRLDFQHYCLRRLLKCDYTAPISRDVRRVLDVGCGTGRWGCEMARQFPMAQVVGLDLEAPLLPVELPRNYRFVRGDVLQALPFADGSFGYVHQRLLAAGIPAPNWPAVLRELVRVTQVGGWIELVECSERFERAGEATHQCLHWWRNLARQRQIDFSLMENLGAMLAAEGVQHITAREIRAPLGSWAGRSGDSFATNLRACWQGLRGPCMASLNITQQEFDATLEAAARQWEEDCTECTFYIFYAQRGAPAHRAGVGR